MVRRQGQACGTGVGLGVSLGPKSEVRRKPVVFRAEAMGAPLIGSTVEEEGPGRRSRPMS